jgi:hypothetical protein
VFDMQDWACRVAWENGLLTAMARQVLQTGLNVEFADHLG